MSNTSQQIVQRVWNYCNTLLDDGVSNTEYIEQITYLLFLKMADEQTKAPWNRPSPLPKGYDWASLVSKDGDALEAQYLKVLEHLGKQKGTLGLIFRKAKNAIQDPAKLRRLVVDLIDREQWMTLDADVKGDIYEGLLEKTAQVSGAGQYFTPRALIRAIVDVMRPVAGERIFDPACGTAGFLLAAHDAVLENSKPLDRDQKKHLKNEALNGWEIAATPARLATMNLLLHGAGGDEPLIRVDDALRSKPADAAFQVCLSNPPFGRKSSVSFINEDGEEERDALTIVREDFWASTSNKQLNFVQHIASLLAINGRAAVVVPDNVLFEGGAGETIRKRLLAQCDVHTLLRLPTGIFYAQGVKANVLFFEKKAGRDKPWTQRLWVYDLRTNKHFTLKTNPLKREHLDEFVKLYKVENRANRKPTWSESSPEGRWRSYSYEALIARDKVNLDVFWLKDESLEESANLPPPEVIAEDISTDLRAALEQIEAIAADLSRAKRAR